MTLSEFKNHLKTTERLQFQLPDGRSVPSHFHITEAGLVTKHFIDCGGQTRTEKKINFQIWVADDYYHRLDSKKLLDIIALSQKVLGDEDLEIEIEYQTDTLGKYGLDFNDECFTLTTKQTDCLAKENCGISGTKQTLQVSEISDHASAGCTPGGGCC